MRRILMVLMIIMLPLLAQAKQMPTHEYHLANGLTLIVREDHRAPVVFSSVWYKVGGSYEHDGITGVSHVLEHMMFEGTHRFGRGQFMKIISNNGGQQNALTAYDFTAYYQKLSADKLWLSFELESDRMRNLLLTPQAFKKEVQVVMEERRLRVDDNPQSVTAERFNAAAYINAPYHHPIVGWMTDLKHLTVQDVKTWYRYWYAPNNAIVVVVGDVTPKEVLALAKKYFGPLKSEQLPKVKPRTEVAPLGTRTVVVKRPAKLPWLIMGYNVPVLTTAKQKWQAYALAVLSGVLDSGASARLNRDLIRGQQIAVSVDAGYNIYQRYNNRFTFSGVPAKQHTITELKAAFLAEIKRLQTTLVSQKELQRVKAQVIAENVYQKDSLMSQAMLIGMPEAVGLSWRDSDQFIRQINKVTPEQLQVVAKLYFKPKRLTVAILKPVAINQTKSK